LVVLASDCIAAAAITGVILSVTPLVSFAITVVTFLLPGAFMSQVSGLACSEVVYVPCNDTPLLRKAFCCGFRRVFIGDALSLPWLFMFSMISHLYGHFTHMVLVSITSSLCADFYMLLSVGKVLTEI
jgi:hypothetical protein